MINTLIVGLLMSLVMLVVLIVVYAVGQAQVIWAQLAITLAILLGPIFIPFLVMPPLSFLFWGWFRTLLTYSLYAAIAAAVFRITTQVGMQMLTTVDGARTVRDTGRKSDRDGEPVPGAPVRRGGVVGVVEGRGVRHHALVRRGLGVLVGRESCDPGGESGGDERNDLNGRKRVCRDLGRAHARGAASTGAHRGARRGGGAAARGPRAGGLIPAGETDHRPGG